MAVNSTTTLLGKTIQEKNELQKRVDACNRLINKWSKDANYADQIAQEDFVQNTLWNCIDELEQALKGGLDE